MILTLDDGTLDHLARAAAALGDTAEELAARLVTTVLRSCDWSTTKRLRDRALFHITDLRMELLAALEKEER